MLASLPRFTLLARRPRPSAPVNFIYRKQMQIFYNKSNFLFFLPAAALTRPGAGALAWDATFGTNGRRAKKSLPAFLARNTVTKKLQKSLFQKSLLNQLGGYLHLAEALVRLLTGAVDTTQQSDAILRVIGRNDQKR